MPGIGIVIPGSGPGTGPIVPAALPSLGVSGYRHRYSGSRLGADATAVASWPDSGSAPSPLSVPGGTGSIVVNRTSAAFPFARFNALSIANTAPDARPGTVMALVANTVASKTVLIALGLSIGKAGNSAMQAAAAGGNNAFWSPAAGGIGSGWVFVMLATNADGSVSTVNVNGVESTKSAGEIVPGAATALTLNSSLSASLDVAEVAAWPTSLIQSDRAAVYAAVKAAYPTAGLP